MALTTVPVELANLDGAVTVNESSADVDFRIESNGNANMLFVNGGNDQVGIGADPSALFHVTHGGGGFDEVARLTSVANSAGDGAFLGFHGNSTSKFYGFIGGYDIGTNEGGIKIGVGNGETAIADSMTKMTIDNDGVIRLKAGTASTGSSSEDSYITHVNTGSTFLNLGTNYTDDAAATQIMNNTTVIAKFTKAGVTMPLQPAFLVKLDGDQNNIAVDGGSNTTIEFDSEIFDVGSNFASNQFTAPVTGKYLLTYMLRVHAFDDAPTSFSVIMETSNRNISNYIDPAGFDSDPDYYTFTYSMVHDMDASDTAKVTVYQAGGSAQADISQYSYFSGQLIS